MDWYYAVGDDQVGPVSDSELAELASRDEITPETLVWHEGMEDWQPYAEVEPPEAEAAEAAATEAPEEGVCNECGLSFPTSEMIVHGDATICAGCKPVFMQRVMEGGSQPGIHEYAGFWLRAAAHIIDNLILCCVAMVICVPLFVVGVMQGLEGEFSDPDDLAKLQGVQLGIQLLIYLIQIVYEVFFVGKYGATPGKMLCGIKIIHSDGGRVSYLRALGRYFAEILSGLICGIGYLMVAFDAEKRALHDHMCSTRVVKK